MAVSIIGACGVGGDVVEMVWGCCDWFVAVCYW